MNKEKLTDEQKHWCFQGYLHAHIQHLAEDLGLDYETAKKSLIDHILYENKTKKQEMK